MLNRERQKCSLFVFMCNPFAFFISSIFYDSKSPERRLSGLLLSYSFCVEALFCTGGGGLRSHRVAIRIRSVCTGVRLLVVSYIIFRFITYLCIGC